VFDYSNGLGVQFFHNLTRKKSGRKKKGSNGMLKETA